MDDGLVGVVVVCMEPGMCCECSLCETVCAHMENIIHRTETEHRVGYKRE